MTRARSRSTPKRAGRRRARAATGPRPTPAEKQLLALAREIARLPLGEALERLAAAWAPGAALPREAARAWLRSRTDKTAALALAWAREQLRLSLQDVVEALPPERRGRIGASPGTLAWILLAACEALAQEPPEAVVERISALLDLTGCASPGGRAGQPGSGAEGR